MPSYSFRCIEGCEFDAMYSMSEVPRQTDCKVCGRAAKRTVTAPHLSATGSSAFQLVDRAARTAHEPDVVSRLPGQGRKPQRFTSNPLHAKLPRS